MPNSEQCPGESLIWHIEGWGVMCLLLLLPKTTPMAG